MSSARLTVKLRGRAEAPDGAEGAQFLSAQGAKPQAHHGPLQRLLGGRAEARGFMCCDGQKPYLLGLARTAAAIEFASASEISTWRSRWTIAGRSCRRAAASNSGKRPLEYRRSFVVMPLNGACFGESEFM